MSNAIIFVYHPILDSFFDLADPETSLSREIYDQIVQMFPDADGEVLDFTIALKNYSQFIQGHFFEGSQSSDVEDSEEAYVGNLMSMFKGIALAKMDEIVSFTDDHEPTYFLNPFPYSIIYDPDTVMELCQTHLENAFFVFLDISYEDYYIALEDSVGVESDLFVSEEEYYKVSNKFKETVHILNAAISKYSDKITGPVSTTVH